MPSSSQPRPLHPVLRLLLAAVSMALVVLLFRVMTTLSRPSQYINAVRVVKMGPGKAADLQRLPVFDFRKCLYLAGPVTPADASLAEQPLFHPDQMPVMPPAVYSDASGAVEVLALTPPLMAQPAATYHFNQPVHMLGWRTSLSGFRLFAVADAQQGLLEMMSQRSDHWQSGLFIHGLWLAGLVFTTFWLLNLVVLSNPSLRVVQLLTVNVVFLILFYSVLILSEFPLAPTVVPTLGILAAANLVFILISWVFGRRTPATEDPR